MKCQIIKHLREKIIKLDRKGPKKELNLSKGF
jgi:hypothetical protein